MSFSLVSINTWKCDGTYFERIPLLVEEINKVTPTLVLCQEVFHCADNSISTKKYFEEKLGMSSYFFASRRKERLLDNVKQPSYSGLCLFTNLEVQFYKEFFLPTRHLDGERTAQLVVIYHEGNKIAIVNTHLTHLKKETNLRIEQLKHIVSTIDGNDYDAFFLCGDFNDTLSSKTIQFLVDTPYYFNNTFTTNNATHISGQCIDYIFYKSKHTIDILDQNIILNQPKDNVLLSDHFGLYSSYKINKNE